MSGCSFLHLAGGEVVFQAAIAPAAAAFARFTAPVPVILPISHTICKTAATKTWTEVDFPCMLTLHKETSMPPPVFAAPQFVGERFESHTLPVSVASDLLAYQSLLIDVAKHLYLQEHPERQRVPKGFADVHLDISSLEAGSVKIVLRLVSAAAIAAGAQLPLPDVAGAEIRYFCEARDVIAECVAGALPEKLPKRMLVHFNRIGRSLKDGEAMLFDVSTNGAVAKLTPERRRQLVLAAGGQSYEKEIELSGYISEADWDKSTIRLHLDDDSSVVVPITKEFHDEVRASWGKRRNRVFIRGVALYDSMERLQKFLELEPIDVARNYDVSAIFDEMEQLQDGWFNGEGKAPDKSRLQQFSALMAAHFPEDLPLPVAVPTPEGNLLLEWQGRGSPSVDVDLATMQAYFHAFDGNGGDIERDFTLSEAREAEAFFAFLSAHIQEQQA